MQQPIQIQIDVEEDEADTIVQVVLNHRGHDFSATGSARRNPADRPLAVIGEELAAARALDHLSRLLMESAQAKIARFAARPPTQPTAPGRGNNHSR